MTDTTPAQIASTDQTLAEFDSLGIEIRPQAPVIAVLAIDVAGVVHASRRPQLPVDEMVDTLRAYADFIEGLSQA